MWSKIGSSTVPALDPSRIRKAMQYSRIQKAMQSFYSLTKFFLDGICRRRQKSHFGNIFGILSVGIVMMQNGSHEIFIACLICREIMLCWFFFFFFFFCKCCLLQIISCAIITWTNHKVDTNREHNNNILFFRVSVKTWDFQQCGMCDQQRLRSACAYAQSDQNIC